MRRIDTSAWWKYTTTSLGTIVVAFSGFWMLEGRNFVDRNEVKRIINEDTPYVRDAPALKQQLAYMTELLVDLRSQQDKSTQFQTTRNDEMRREIAELQRQVALLNQKIESKQ